MKVTFAVLDERIASSRLRAKIPQQELAKLGIKQGRDVLIYGKSVVTSEQLKHFLFKIYDVCDDHYDTPELKDYYRKHTAEADAVTCNSEAMRERIKQVTGRDATVIKEPYEGDELKPSIGANLLWFGHASNVKDLDRIAPQLKHPILALSNHEDCVPWSPESFAAAMKQPCIVIIPTGKSLCKSENRMVESIRNGKYVCAEHLPAYEPFSEFFPLGDIPAQIDWALNHPTEALTQISLAQSYISQNYSPEKIGRDWLKVIHEHY